MKSLTLNIKKLELVYYLFALTLILTIYDFPDIWNTNSNLVAYLSSIIKTEDPSYLTNDFYFQTNQGFGPRYFYIKFFQIFTNANNFPYIALSAHLVLKFSICLITVYVAREFFPGNRLAQFIAPACVMTIEGPILLQYGNVLQHDSMSPQLMSLPFILLSFLMALRLQPVKCALFAYLAAVFHPNVGTIFGSIFLFSQLVILFVLKKPEGDVSKLKSALLSLVLFYVLIVITWVIPLLLQTRIPDREFLDIILLRAPHHLLFSNEKWRVYFNLVAFIFASLISICLWKKYYQIKTSSWLVTILTILAIPLIFFFGFLLTDIFPNRLGPTLFASRYVEILRYLGIVLMSGILSHLVLKFRNQLLFAIVYAVSLPHPVQLALTATYIKFSNNFLIKNNYILIVLLLISGFSAFNSSLVTNQVIYFYSIIVILIYALPKTRVVPNVILFTFLCLIMFGLVTRFNYYPSSVRDYYRTLGIARFSMQPPRNSFYDLAKFAKEHTKDQALFLTPPYFTSFRITAQRAVLVDFKSFPFQDISMREWYMRLRDVFEPLKSTGFNLNRLSKKAYAHLTTKKLIYLRNKYSIDYAILYRSTPTIFPIVYQNNSYQVVKLS